MSVVGSIPKAAVTTATQSGRGVVIAVSLGAALTGVDALAVSVALPSIQGQLGMSQAGMEWVIGAYLLAGGALMLLMGRLADLLGRRTIFSAGVALFVAASLAAGVASSATLLIIARLLQGAGAAALLPSGVAVITHAFPDPKARNGALATWVAVFGVGVAIGPLAGGLLTQAFGWRAIFLINVPIGGLALLLTRRLVPPSRDEDAHPRIDWLGASLVTAALACVMTGVIQAPTWGWGSAEVLGLLSAGALLLCGFIAVELKSTMPLLDLRLFARRSFAGALLASATLYFATIVWIFFYSLELQDVLGHGPITSGLLLAPGTLAMVAMTGPSGKLTTRFGARTPILLGALLSCFGFVMLAGAGTHPTYGDLWLGFACYGAGAGLALAPLNVATVAAVPSGKAGAASGINQSVRWLGSATGIAVAGTMFQTLLRHRLADLPITAVSGRHLAQLGGGNVGHVLALAHEPGALGAVLRGAFAHGLSGVTILAAAMCTLEALAAVAIDAALGRSH